MHPFIVSSFGTFVMALVQDLFTAPSEQTFLLLAWGWVLAGRERHTITTYLWLTGATRVKHFSRFYVFLGGPLYNARWKLWGRILHCAVRWVPQDAVQTRRPHDEQPTGSQADCGRVLSLLWGCPGALSEDAVLPAVDLW